jgi:hypothetical protein
MWVLDRRLGVPQSRSGRNGGDKIIALTGSNLSDQQACRLCVKCAIATPLIKIVGHLTELRTS